MSFQILWRDKLFHDAGTLNFGENFWNDIVVPYGFFFFFQLSIHTKNDFNYLINTK